MNQYEASPAELSGSILAIYVNGIQENAAMNQQTNTPGLINWLGYLAITLLLLLPVSVITVRAEVWQLGLLLYAIACLGSALLVVLGIALLLLPRFAPWRKGIVKRMLFAVPGLALLTSLASGGNYPAIHDITTDTNDPPLFITAAEQRGESANLLEINAQVVAQQIQAYPDLESLTTSMPTSDAFDHAVQIATDLGWEIYYQDRNAGVIEAVDTTNIMAFKDDVIIRVRTNGQGSLLDLRSVSRVGESDIGANAKRIRLFIEAFRYQRS